MSRNGVNGWNTEAEARVVLAAFVGQAAAVNKTVSDANKASLGKSVEADVNAAKDAAIAAGEKVKTPLGAALASATVLYVGGILAGGAALYYWLTRRRGA